ncbi:hypothetical protein CAEBREN_08773 [Caenorhabditis brenneri]|uniref:Uncharacterized protein n=1 Tax=Caenorhabditis brenneri TaxID=135651 RepID=G0PNW3_CAEBE|nr:hypothetical protein CAEBREN_08773 [Caenorhabditis brenneri]
MPNMYQIKEISKPETYGRHSPAGSRRSPPLRPLLSYFVGREYLF